MNKTEFLIHEEASRQWKQIGKLYIRRYYNCSVLTSLPVNIKIAVDRIHCFHQLVNEYKWSNHNKRSEDVP